MLLLALEEFPQCTYTYIVFVRVVRRGLSRFFLRMGIDLSSNQFGQRLMDAFLISRHEIKIDFISHPRYTCPIFSSRRLYFKNTIENITYDTNRQ